MEGYIFIKDESIFVCKNCCFKSWASEKCKNIKCDGGYWIKDYISESLIKADELGPILGTAYAAIEVAKQALEIKVNDKVFPKNDDLETKIIG